MGLVGFESAPRYRELLYKLISEDLEFPPPGFILELDRPEWSFLKDEILFITQPQTASAVAAQLGFVQALNPVGSTRIVAVQRAFAKKATAGDVNVALTTTVRGAGVTIAVPRDTRWNSPITPTAALVARDPVSMSVGTVAAFGSDTVIATDSAGVNVWTEIRIPNFVLAPGTGLVVANATVNEAL